MTKKDIKRGRPQRYDDGTVDFHLMFEPELKKRTIEEAKKRGCSTSKLVRDAVEMYMDNKSTSQPPNNTSSINEMPLSRQDIKLFIDRMKELEKSKVFVYVENGQYINDYENLTNQLFTAMHDREAIQVTRFREFISDFSRFETHPTILIDDDIILILRKIRLFIITNQNGYRQKLR